MKSYTSTKEKDSNNNNINNNNNIKKNTATFLHPAFFRYITSHLHEVVTPGGPAAPSEVVYDSTNSI